MGKFTKRQQENFDLFSQLSYEDLDVYIKGQQHEISLGYMDQNETLLVQRALKIAKIVRRIKKRDLSK